MFNIPFSSFLKKLTSPLQVDLFVIVAFFENGTKEYSLRVPLCVCPCVCVGGCLHDNLKSNRSRNIVLYENSSDEFDIEHRQIKVKVTVGLHTFSLFTTIQTVRSYKLKC